MKKLFVALLLFSSVFMLTPSACALNSAVYFEGGADNFVFYPGTSWSEVDLFDGFKNVMPGDRLTETVKVRNTAPEYDYIKIYLRADPHNDSTNPLSDSVSEEETVASMEDFLAQLSMRVYNGGDLIYNATPDKLDGLKNNVLLGEFVNGASTTLTVELTVPKTLGNEYMHRAGEVDWIFTAEGYVGGEIVPSDDNPPNNGGNTDGSGRKPKPLPDNAITLDKILSFVTPLILSVAGILLALYLIRHYLKQGQEKD